MAKTYENALMSLEAELLAVDGVAQAEVDLESDGPIGLKITIVSGADSALVAQQVSEVLANRGLSSSVTPIAQASGYRGTIVAGEASNERISPLRTPSRKPSSESSDTPETNERRSTRDTEAGVHSSDPADPWPIDEQRSTIQASDSVVSGDSSQAEDPAPTVAESRAIGSSKAMEVATAAISENAKGVELALRMADGRRVSRRTRPTPEAVAQGVVTALTDLVDGLVEPVSLVDFERRVVDAVTVVTVVVSENSRVGVGSAKEHGTEILSVAKAAWKAISDLDR